MLGYKDAKVYDGSFMEWVGLTPPLQLNLKKEALWENSWASL
jgi:3-mercaptopyruvate sulfurtransferase SseA